MSDGSNFVLVEREYIHPNIAGSVYGGKPFLLARTQDRILAWVPGYSCYGGRMSPTAYMPSHLLTHVRRETGFRGITHLWSNGGRLTAVLKKPEVCEKIDRFFGDGFYRLLEADKTVIVGDNPPWSGHEDDVRHKFGYGHEPDSAKLVRELQERMK